MPGTLGSGQERGKPDQVCRRKTSFQGSPASEQSFTSFPVQETPPYNLKAFNLRINFPREYPLRPPTVTFTTPIYHPNVDPEGRVCLPITSNQHWKPYTKAYQGGRGVPAARGLCGRGYRADLELEKVAREEIKCMGLSRVGASDRRDVP